MNNFLDKLLNWKLWVFIFFYLLPLSPILLFFLIVGWTLEFVEWSSPRVEYFYYEGMDFIAKVFKSKEVFAWVTRK